LFWSIGCKNLLQKNNDVGTIKSWKLTKKFEISKQNSCAILLHRIDYILRFPPMIQVRTSATKKGSTIVGIIHQLHREKKVESKIPGSNYI
jgi:hypothetical protein